MADQFCCDSTTTIRGSHFYNHMLRLCSVSFLLCPVPRVPHYSHYYAGILGASLGGGHESDDEDMADAFKKKFTVHMLHPIEVITV